MDRLKDKIRDIPDFPKAGILFKDITPLVQDPTSLRIAISELIKPYKGKTLQQLQVWRREASYLAALQHGN